MEGFHEYIDLARVFWALDEARIRAIAESETAAPVFRDLAHYIQELKADLGSSGTDQREAETAAITKVAVRLAGIPEHQLVGALSGLPKRAVEPRRRSWWRMSAGLLALLLIGLLAGAALATAGVDLPEPVESVLERIGVVEAQDPSSSQIEPEGSRATSPPVMLDVPNVALELAPTPLPAPGAPSEGITSANEPEEHAPGAIPPLADHAVGLRELGRSHASDRVSRHAASRSTERPEPRATPEKRKQP